MKRVYQSTDYYSAQLIKAYLADNGVEANVTGEYLLGAAGEIPANSFPSVWIVDDQQLEQAKTLIKQYEADTSVAVEQESFWTCPDCKEPIESQFTQCWKCGATRIDQ